MAEATALLFSGTNIGALGAGGGGMQAVTSGTSGLALPRVGKRGAPQAFARKLYEILTTESTSVIAWNKQGTAFHVKDVDAFSEQTLTKYYRHSKFSSFQRQLNLYSFRKIVKGPDTGGYAHPMFHRDRPDDLYHVRRSISGSSSNNSKQATGGTGAGTHPTSVVTGAVVIAANTTPAAARRSAGRAASKADTADWAAPRVFKSSANARRTGKLKHALKAPSKSSLRAHEKRTASTTAIGAALVEGQQQVGGDGLSPAWTSGESSGDDSLASGDESDPELSQQASGGAVLQSVAAASDSDNIGESSVEDSDSDSDNSGESRQQQKQGLSRFFSPLSPPDSTSTGNSIISRKSSSKTEPAAAGGSADGFFKKRESSLGNLFSKRSVPTAQQQQQAGDAGAGVADKAALDEPNRRGDGVGAGAGEVSADGDGTSTSQRSSPFGWFSKKTFSGPFAFMDKHHRRNLSTSSVDMTSAETSSSNSTSIVAAQDALTAAAGASALEHNMPSAAGRRSASNDGVNLPSTGPRVGGVTGLEASLSIDKNAVGNGSVSSGAVPDAAGSAGVPRISLGKDSATATADAVAMPPPPKREQREELGLVEQLTNMVEVFDICDLLRRVSTSGRPLDKDGKASSGSFNGSAAGSRTGSSQHLRQMSVDTDVGVAPGSPQESHGLPSLASMELMRDPSRDWDTLMASSADVSDIGNTMVQSVAEFFSF